MRRALGTIFSIETGLSDDSAKAMFQRSLADADWSHQLQLELEQAFASPKTPWKDLLSNAEYEVFDAETDSEARDFIAESLLKPIRERTEVAKE